MIFFLFVCFCFFSLCLSQPDSFVFSFFVLHEFSQGIFFRLLFQQVHFGSNASVGCLMSIFIIEGRRGRRATQPSERPDFLFFLSLSPPENKNTSRPNRKKTAKKTLTFEKMQK